MRLAFESVDSGKQIAFPNVSGHQPYHGAARIHKGRGGRIYISPIGSVFLECPDEYSELLVT